MNEDNYETLIKKTIETYDKIAKEYANKFKSIEPIKHLLKFFVKNIEGKRILDAGCGHGRDCKYFSELGFEVYGIDLSEKLLEIAKKNAPEAKFFKMDMRKLEFPDEFFDGIWCCASFLHIPKKDAEKTLREFYRVLKKNGILFIAVKKGIGEKVMRKDYYKGGEKFFVFYTRDEIEELLRKVNFRIILTIIDKDDRGNTWIQVFCKKV